MSCVSLSLLTIVPYQGLDVEWCKHPDAGLMAPDLLIHLHLSVTEAESRGGFGDERYERHDVQERVAKQV